MDDKELELYKNTVRKMMHISRLHRCVFEKNISQLGIHHSQHHLLMYIAKKGDVNSQKEIAEKFNITPAAVARSLKTLELEGYVTRCNTDGDNRYNKIVVTEKGKSVAEQSYKMFIDTDKALFRDFTDEDMLSFNAYLDKIQAKLLDEQRKSDEEN